MTCTCTCTRCLQHVRASGRCLARRHLVAGLTPAEARRAIMPRLRREVGRALSGDEWGQEMVMAAYQIGIAQVLGNEVTYARD